MPPSPRPASADPVNHSPDHADIYVAVNNLRQQLDLHELGQRTVMDVVERMEKKVDSALRAIGSEGRDDYGKPIGTGVVGRLMRLETRVDGRFSTYDGWVKYARGAALAAVLSGTALWWLIGDRLGGLFK